MNDRCDLCHHSLERHLDLTEAKNGNPATWLCLTGFCRCGMKKPKLRIVKARTKTPLAWEMGEA